MKTRLACLRALRCLPVMFRWRTGTGRFASFTLEVANSTAQNYNTHTNAARRASSRRARAPSRLGSDGSHAAGTTNRDTLFKRCLDGECMRGKSRNEFKGVFLRFFVFGVFLKSIKKHPKNTRLCFCVGAEPKS